MKGFIVVALLALAGVPVVTLAQSGNVHGSPNKASSATPNSGAMMGPSPLARTTNSRSGLSGAGGASGARFNAIAHGRHYITRAQAKRYDPTLYRHFRRCDVLRDGRVTRTEFKNCRGGHARGRPAP